MSLGADGQVDIAGLVEAIDDEPDSLHGDRTPAVHALIQRGLEVLPHLFPLLEGAEELTRLRAQRVLEGVTLKWVREEVSGRALARADRRAWERLWQENSGYDWRASPSARARSVDRWRAWHNERDAPPDR